MDIWCPSVLSVKVGADFQIGRKDTPMVLIVISLIVGLLIGAVGIGGVLLVPGLSIVAGIGVHEAIPACMLSYLATGAVGVLIYTRHGSIKWSMVGWLTISAMPTAYLGSVMLEFIPSEIILLLIACLMIFAGADAAVKALRSQVGERNGSLPGVSSLLAIGALTGFGSAITGTGGPLIVVPVMLFLGVPVLTAVGLSQAIQIPIAIFASIGNLQAGTLNLDLSLTIAASMIVGSFAGATVIHYLPREPVRNFVAVLLIVVGVGISVRLGFQTGFVG
jgi:uncharacterized protein